jgi:hypothetical protein
VVVAVKMLLKRFVILLCFYIAIYWQVMLLNAQNTETFSGIVYNTDGVNDGVSANIEIVIYFNPIEDYRLPRKIGETHTDENGVWRFSLDYSLFEELQGELLITPHRKENTGKVWHTMMPFVIPINKPIEIQSTSNDKPF